MSAELGKYKPYPEYKHSRIKWLGVIPLDWEITKIRFVSECLDGKRVPLNAEQRGKIPGDYPYWGANGVVDYVDNWLFDEDLILIGEDGAPFFEPNKDVAFNVSGKIWVNNHAHILRPKVDTVCPVFLKYALNQVDFYLIYSYLKASIGFNLAAFLAGKYPKNTPIKVEKKNEINTICVFKINGKFITPTTT